MQDKRTLTIVLNEIPKEATLRTLIDNFEKYGHISSVKITPRIRNDVQLYVGFLTFENVEEGKKFMVDSGEKTTILNKEVTMSYATSGKRNSKDAYIKAGFHRTKVYVSGIPPTYTEEDLIKLLGDCKLYLPKDGKGYCFANFEDEKTKNEVIIKHDGTKLDDKHELKFAPAFIGGKMNGGPRSDFKKRSPRTKETTME